MEETEKTRRARQETATLALKVINELESEVLTDPLLLKDRKYATAAAYLGAFRTRFVNEFLDKWKEWPVIEDNSRTG